MANEWDHSEEYQPLPEHHVYPEYTPEYPDVTFFKESYVTSLEENIFQGEVPPGEEPWEDIREEKKKKRNREGWLRWFLGGAVRAGAALFAIIMLIMNAWAKEEPGTVDTRAKFVKVLGVDLLRDPFTPQQDYTPEELGALWKGDPIAPHKYDYDHLIVLEEPTCQKNGMSAYACEECGVLLKHVTTKDHEPAEVVQENVVEPDCENAGSCEEVVYCADCGTEISRTKAILAPLGHTGGDVYVENIVAPGCTTEGSCEDVIYCTDCGQELSRTKRVLDAVGHIGGDPVIETIVEPGCTTEGSGEEIIYCAVCGEEISRTQVVLEPTGHTPGEAVMENKVDPTCTGQGTYDEVIYCTVCNEEVSRTQMVLEPTGHKAADAVTETKKEATCTEKGKYDEVVYCSVCKEELSRTHKESDALGHKYKDKVTKATCTEQGYTTHTCSRCKDSYKDTYTKPLGHNYKEKVTKASCEKQGYTTHTCSRCGDSYKDTYTDALGHNYNAKVTDPTCTKEGYTTHTCSRCGDSYRDNTKAALGHDFPIGSGHNGATCVCSRCGLEGITFSYSTSDNLIHFTLNSAFASALVKAGFSRGEAYVEETSGGWLGETGSWSSGNNSGKIEYSDLNAGTYSCRLVFIYGNYNTVTKTKRLTVR